jgi:hypothetical protein
MHFFCKWEPWEQYQQKKFIIKYNGEKVPYVEERQKRKCSVCGYVEDEKVG